ncbi:MerR family transcriptional regulator [Bacillus ginsengihumi]|uniref:MerR family transcriptional regulator n=1 Tax=Heyndrickxia ginsengihumi TaxID=363870 RepID=A0A6M0PCJ8_9BACI|nr:MerR family transcriptional regulator [Heyndrickxia ginsengihumi]NEY21378.1 MerR family transcriptional regulator [Heyndrickxia ginsengihumi]
MSTYQIDEVAKLCGLTKRTIRYYEEIGLLSPPERTNGGFRKYSAKHLERLHQIINAREVLGISLQEIQEFIAIREEINNQMTDLKQTVDTDIKHQKLLRFKEVLDKQRMMIDRKMKKISEIKEDTDQYYIRICEAIKKYEKE